MTDHFWLNSVGLVFLGNNTSKAYNLHIFVLFIVPRTAAVGELASSTLGTAEGVSRSPATCSCCAFSWSVGLPPPAAGGGRSSFLFRV